MADPIHINESHIHTKEKHVLIKIKEYHVTGRNQDCKFLKILSVTVNILRSILKK